MINQTPPFAGSERSERSGRGFDFTFGISAALGQLDGSMQEMVAKITALHKWLTENARQEPFPTPIANSVNSGAAAPTYLVIPLIGSANLTGPPAGTRWSVGRLSVWGTDPFTPIAAGQAALFKSGTTPPSGAQAPNVGLVAVSGAAGTIPWTVAFARHALSVHSTEDLYVVTKGHGNSQLLTVEVEVVQFSERRYIAP